MAVTSIDVDYLSAYLSLPQQTLSTAIDAPTAALVRAVLEAVTAKAREHDEINADKLRVDIELENAVRSSGTRAEGLRSQVEKAQKAVEEVRTQLKEEENARSALESQLQSLKSSSTTSTSELETLRTRISSLEAANRDTVAVLESKTTANDSLAQDLQKQHQKGLELSQQITILKQSIQNAETAASSARFREQSLKQEVELVKKNNEWFENELKTKSAESMKYRKEKGARIAELQRENEQLTANYAALERTEKALRNRLDEIQKKADDSLSTVQQLQEAAAKTEEGFRQELESARRLGELQAQQTETHRSRLKDVEAALEKARDEAADEISKARQDVETERHDREQAEHRLAELESEVDRLHAASVAQPQSSSVPGTPRNGLNGSVYGRAGSPAQFGTPGSARSKAPTVTQAMEEVYKYKGLLVTERRRSERLAQELEEMIQGLEAKQPVIETIEAENDRLQQEIVAMSAFVDETGKERDRAKKDLRKLESQASTAQAEANILRQQLQDLSAQIKMLLFDQSIRDQNLDALSAEERAQYERLARGDDQLGSSTATDQYISEHLAVFRSVEELQKKNEDLLKITRQLGAKMETEEALAAKNQAASDHEEVQKLLATIENYKDEIRSMLTRSESYITERDMFRRMLQNRGQLPPNPEHASTFSQSVGAIQNGIIPTIEQKDNANYAALLRELQGHYDQYRVEQSIDRRTMKEQIDKLSLEKGALQAEVAKVSSKFTLAGERYEMLQSNFVLIQNENTELQKRSQILSEAAAKQDLRTQQVAEELVEKEGLLESMRNETSNLKAEKNLWKDVQDRLSQDNERLTNEQSRLNNLISNQQTLQNERELSDSETRRRLQAQVESLEAELSATKRKLNDEMQDSKNTQLRKEFDSKEHQKRIDNLATTLNQVREELIAAKTSRDHLQSRVDELTIELKSAEERVVLLQPRPTPRPIANAENSMEHETLTKEQELAIEVSELKRDLELSKSELESAESQMEQYKSISQASEEELQSINATQDLYREEMDQILEDKDSKIRELQQRVEDISTELATTNNELTNLRNQQSEIARQGQEEKAVLEAEIARLKDEGERHATAARFHQQDLRAQAAIATKAQQDYENELLKHAEAAKLLQNLRAEYNQMKTDSATLKAEAESARVALSQSEMSWEERRQQFEQELGELRTRRDDVNAQNKLLHQQLDNVGAQITALQQSRSSLAEAEAGSPSVDSTGDRAADGLRELNTFLRREKEIVEVQFELKVQEAKRLKQQLDYAQSQLDESRLKLDQERRVHADLGRSSTVHKDAMEQLQELNLHREASVTLRNEARQAQAQLVEKTKRVEALLEQIQPLETKIRELEHGKETTDGEMRLLQEDRDRWQKRTQDIISKYDRIDPAEMDQLKETIETLRAQRDSLLEEQKPLKEQCETFETEKATWQQSRTKLIEQAKERSRTQGNSIRDRTAERDAAIQEKEDLQQRLSTLEQELETAVQEKNAAEQNLATISQELETARSEREQAPDPVSQTPIVQAPVATEVAGESVEDLNQKLSELSKKLEEATKEKDSLQGQLVELQKQLTTSNTERDAAIAEAAEARSQQTQASTGALEAENEDGQIDETPQAGLPENERKALEDRVTQAEERVKDAERKAAEIEASQAATLKQRSDKMKGILNDKLKESKETLVKEALAKAKDEYEAEISLKYEQEKQIWIAENKTGPSSLAVTTTQAKPNVAPTSATPATPTQKTPGTASSDFSALTDVQVRELLANNQTARSIFSGNLKNKVAAETQKLKEEHEKAIAEAQQKADTAQTNAVALAERKSSLQVNMANNRSKGAQAKLDVVEKAATETPEKPVGEVWEIAKVAKPPPPPPASVAVPPTQTNGTAVPQSAEVKSETSSTEKPQAQQHPSGIPTAPSGPSSAPASTIPSAPQAGNNNRQSGIPTRGGAANRGGPRGGAYQRGGANNNGAGRGRGSPGGNRGGIGGGGMNAAAPTFNPNGIAGAKRPRDEGSIGGPQQGNGAKRPRGGGPNN